MSRQATREVTFISEGKIIQTVTDAKTARAIGKYKDVYNKIERFKITSNIVPGKIDGFLREEIIARSPRLKIVCIKEYIPNVPEILDSATYKCGILNTKNKKFDIFDGGLPMLYYKLLHGRAK